MTLEIIIDNDRIDAGSGDDDLDPAAAPPPQPGTSAAMRACLADFISQQHDQLDELLIGDFFAYFMRTHRIADKGTRDYLIREILKQWPTAGFKKAALEALWRDIGKEIFPRKPTQPRQERADETDDLAGRPVELIDPEPWPQPVDAAAVLDEIANFANMLVVLSPEYADAVALWVAHTYACDQMLITPRLAITAGCEECGKTVLLDYVIAGLSLKGLYACGLTPSVFFRLSEDSQPTFCLDEIDEWFKSDPSFIAYLNSNRDSGRVFRSVGEKFHTRQFTTFSPVAAAGIRLDDRFKKTTISRCITLRMDRATPSELSQIRRFVPTIHKPMQEIIRRKISRMIADSRAQLADSQDAMIHTGRYADNWMPLLAIAQLGGPLWIRRAEIAKACLTKIAYTEADPSIIEQLMDDLDAVISAPPLAMRRAVQAKELTEGLLNLPDNAVWTGFNFSKPDALDRHITPSQVTKLLKSLRAIPKMHHDTQFQDRPKHYSFARQQIVDVIEKYRRKPPSDTAEEASGEDQV